VDSIIAKIQLPCRAIKQGPEKSYTLLGSSLCNLDIFSNDSSLPTLEVGDYIVFDNAGAYNFFSEFTGSGNFETYNID
jgi:diaminopimelate decarboxylase